MLPLLFLGLAAPMIRRQRDWIVAASAVVTALIATMVLPPAWQITGAAAVASLVGIGFSE
jgi:predicted branched-subunit amino acid permease